MKVLLVNGSPNKAGCTYTALKEIADQLKTHGIESEFFHLGSAPVAGCIACHACDDGNPCVLSDDVYQRFISAAKEVDGYIFGSPVYYASINASLGCLLDRVFFSQGTIFQHKPTAGIVSSRRGGSGSAFDRLNKYFSYARMSVISSQYWNIAHGAAPGEVREDKEGLQIMRTLARNMAWSIRNTRLAGQAAPIIETPRERTNFVR